MDRVFAERGFLPAEDPLVAFPYGSPLSVLDEIGRDLPSLLQDEHFREHARGLTLPPCPDDRDAPITCGSFVSTTCASASWPRPTSTRSAQPPATLLPRNLAVPLCEVCSRLRRPPILSYDGYALYNWKRFDPAGPIALGNIDTIQNFVHLYDEHWFILVHVEIEAIAARHPARRSGAWERHQARRPRPR